MPDVSQALAILGGSPIRKASWPKWPTPSAGIIEDLEKALASSRWTVSSHFTGEPSFEATFAKRFSTFNNVAHCVPCCSGTAALTIALEALGVGQNDEVLVPGLTWVACASAVLRVGACPVLVDIDPYSLCMSPQAARASLCQRTRAIILVHSYCSVADVSAFLALSHEHSLYLIEDCSQAHGATYFGKTVGGFGDVSVFSMQQSKVLTCGEGGAVLTNDSRLFERLDQLRADGRETVAQPRLGQFQLSPRGHVQGHNYCLSEFHAAILMHQLENLMGQNRRRSENATYLNALLRESTIFQPIYQSTKEVQPIVYKYCLRLCHKHFAGLDIQLLARTVATELSLSIETLHPPLNRNVLYRPSLSKRLSPDVRRYLNSAQFNLSNAEAAWNACLAIPHHAFLGTMSDMEDIAAALKKLSIAVEDLYRHATARTEFMSGG